MNKFKDSFLNSPAWLMFLLVFALPFVNLYLSTGVLLFQTPSQSYVDSTFCSYYKFISPYIDSIIGFIYYGWLWSVAAQFQAKLPIELKLKDFVFKTVFPFTLLYHLGLDKVIMSIPQISSHEFGSAFMTPFALFHFYVIWFVAKTLKTIEYERQVGAKETILDFFAILLFPIGVWYLQPRVNKCKDKYL